MPAVSKSQQRIFGAALAYKRGTNPGAGDEIKRLADSMSEETITHYAATPTEDLPVRVKSSMKHSDILKQAGVLDNIYALKDRLTEGLALKAQQVANASRVPAARDVLTGSSMAVPKDALKIVGGGLAGAAGGQLISHLFTPSIDDGAPHSEAKEIQAKRRRIALLGALVGAGGVGGHLYGDQIKAKLGL